MNKRTIWFGAEGFRCHAHVFDLFCSRMISRHAAKILSHTAFKLIKGIAERIRWGYSIFNKTLFLGVALSLVQ